MVGYFEVHEIRKIIKTMQAGLDEILTTVEKLQELADKKTCNDCINFDSANDICAKFKMKPPVFVIVDAAKHCPELDFIPF